MNFFINILDPSTSMGALLISVIAGLISGGILGFISGRKYERSKMIKVSQIGKGNKVKINNGTKG